MERFATKEHKKLEGKIRRDKVYKPQAVEGEAKTRYGLRVYNDDATDENGGDVVEHELP